MSEIIKIQVAKGIYWVEIPRHKLYILCGCPADSVKHLMKMGLIAIREEQGITFETGPNAILLSDVLIQNGAFSNLAEFPILQMLYRQGMIIPNHPMNTGQKPLLIGSRNQVLSQIGYIYRGTYGLTTEEELVEAGASPGQARDLLRMKLAIIYGRIRPTEELLDTLFVGNNPVELREGVFIRRIRLNVFEFSYGSESVTVDLNLPPLAQYDPPYALSFHDVKREYFAVIHSGNGDGWDARRPVTSSIIMFQGRVYLIDAGPNILYTLKALGIGPSEIEGIFHTHAHDDHFCGLATLMHSDRRIKYYSTSIVRACVAKKLTALLSTDEAEFDSYFEVHDLQPETWNDIDGLEVMPMLSPHPVETTIMIYRAMSGEGYKTFAHFADIASSGLLKSIIEEDVSLPGISRRMYETVMKSYLTRVDLKKVDVGGGQIHGDAEDFRSDASPRIILSHASSELTDAQKEIGSGAPFGIIDILIPANQDYRRLYALNLLRSSFPALLPHQLQLLVNNTISTFNPEATILKSGTCNSSIYLVLSGEVDMISTETEIHNTLSAGAFVGATSALTGTPSTETYTAAGFVSVLELPSQICFYLTKGKGILEGLIDLQERRQFLERTWLFGEAISYPVQLKIARALEKLSFPSGMEIVLEDGNGLYLVERGRVQLLAMGDPIEVLRNSDFFGEESVLFESPRLFRACAADDSQIYRIPGDLLLDLPIIRWKLLETYQKRMEMLFNPSLMAGPIFQWREEYATNIKDMDSDHKKLFVVANEIYQAVSLEKDPSRFDGVFDYLLDYAEKHFSEEEDLMLKNGFPEYERHRKQHLKFTQEIQDMQKSFTSDRLQPALEFMTFLRDWIINHLLTEDRKYGHYLNQKGIF